MTLYAAVCESTGHKGPGAVPDILYGEDFLWTATSFLLKSCILQNRRC